MGDKPGDGQALKTVNQLLCGVHIAAAAEALALADALGLDPAKRLEALEAGAAASFMLANRGPRILEAYADDGAEVLSRLDIFVKDMGIVSKAARAAGLPTPRGRRRRAALPPGPGPGPRRRGRLRRHPRRRPAPTHRLGLRAAPPDP